MDFTSQQQQQHNVTQQTECKHIQLTYAYTLTQRCRQSVGSQRQTNVYKNTFEMCTRSNISSAWRQRTENERTKKEKTNRTIFKFTHSLAHNLSFFSRTWVQSVLSERNAWVWVHCVWMCVCVFNKCKKYTNETIKKVGKSNRKTITRHSRFGVSVCEMVW